MSILKSINESSTNDYIEKRKEYINYINEHKANVKKAFKTLFVDNDYFNSDHRIREAIAELQHNGNINTHDDSKFSEEEFEPYRMSYYSVNEEEKKNSEKILEEAWKHHYDVNKHHWNHWVLSDNTGAVEMDLISVIEMICDWQAMSMKFNNKMEDWYNDNKKDMIMHPKTVELVEYILNIISKGY